MKCEKKQQQQQTIEIYYTIAGFAQPIAGSNKTSQHPLIPSINKCYMMPSDITDHNIVK